MNSDFCCIYFCYFRHTSFTAPFLLPLCVKVQPFFRSRQLYFLPLKTILFLNIFLFNQFSQSNFNALSNRQKNNPIISTFHFNRSQIYSQRPSFKLSPDKRIPFNQVIHFKFLFMRKFFHHVVVLKSQSLPFSLVLSVIVIVGLLDSVYQRVVLFCMESFKEVFFFLCPTVDFVMLLLEQLVFLKINKNLLNFSFLF